MTPAVQSLVVAVLALLVAWLIWRVRGLEDYVVGKPESKAKPKADA